MLKFLYVVSASFAVLLILFLLDFIIISKDKAPLLAAIGIILSAFIASLSVRASINNTNRIENDKQKKEIDNELRILKFKTLILKEYLSIYFKDEPPAKADNCMVHSRDESFVFFDKLNNYKEFIDTKVKHSLEYDVILDLLKDIRKNIDIVESEEKFKQEAPKKGFTIQAHLEQALIHALEKLEEQLDRFVIKG